MTTVLRPIVMAAAVVLLVVAAYGVVHRYQPLAQVGELATSSDAGAVLVEEFEGTGATIVNYEHNAYLSYAFTLRNTGPVGVTVTSVDLPDERARRMLHPVQTSVFTSAAATPDDLADMAPLQPFALGPGEERRIVVQARFDNCEYYTERGTELTHGHDVTFRVAGVKRTAELQFNRPLIVRSPTILGCDDRTLDRSEHRRSAP